MKEDYQSNRISVITSKQQLGPHFLCVLKTTVSLNFNVLG